MAGKAVLTLLAAGVGFAAGYLLYPWPDSSTYETLIGASASEFGVDPRLVRAVIEVESGGDPDAVSHRGAVGLMQLMPDTAGEVARALSMDDHDLHSPGDNIRLGTCHLSRLLEIFDHQVPLAVAAYNAGRTPVERWAEEAPHLSAMQVIETLAFDETRVYVLRVLTSYGR